MRWKIETIRYAQGWLGTQLHTMNEAAIAASPDPDNSMVEFHGAFRTMEQIVAQWRVVDEALDDLTRENAELKRKLEGIMSLAAARANAAAEKRIAELDKQEESA